MNHVHVHHVDVHHANVYHVHVHHVHSIVDMDMVDMDMNPQSIGVIIATEAVMPVYMEVKLMFTSTTRTNKQQGEYRLEQSASGRWKADICNRIYIY